MNNWVNYSVQAKCTLDCKLFGFRFAVTKLSILEIFIHTTSPNLIEIILLFLSNSVSHKWDLYNTVSLLVLNQSAHFGRGVSISFLVLFARASISELKLAVSPPFWIILWLLYLLFKSHTGCVVKLLRPVYSSCFKAENDRAVDVQASNGDPSLWEMTASLTHSIQHLKPRKPLMKRALFLCSSVYRKAKEKEKKKHSYHNSDAVPAPAVLCLQRAWFPAPTVESMGLEHINILLALSSIQ